MNRSKAIIAVCAMGQSRAREATRSDHLVAMIHGCLVQFVAVIKSVSVVPFHSLAVPNTLAQQIRKISKYFISDSYSIISVITSSGTSSDAGVIPDTSVRYLSWSSA